MTKTNTTDLLDIEGVAKLLKMAPRTVRAWVADGKIPHKKVVGSIRFDRDEIKTWINEQSK